MQPTLLHALFPGECPGCGRPADPVCDDCRRTLVAAPAAVRPPGLDSLDVALAYTGTARELVARAKYRGHRAALPWLAALLVRALSNRALDVDVVVWAPTTARRRRERGFDHAEVLARAVGRGIGRPVRGHLVRRAGGFQTGRSRAERLNTPVFGVRPGARLTGARVLVVDDVVTTGATMCAAASALRSAGAVVVAGAAVARRP